MYFSQPVGNGGVTVSLPASVTVAVASNSPTLAPGNIPGQFIATGIKSTGQPIQPAPPTPLTLLQVTEDIIMIIWPNHNYFLSNYIQVLSLNCFYIVVRS